MDAMIVGFFCHPFMWSFWVMGRGGCMFSGWKEEMDR